MILIDTNVISELMLPDPDKTVLAWFGEQDTETLFLSAVTEAELRRGAAIMRESKHQVLLTAAINRMITVRFPDRVLPFNSASAQAFADIFTDRRKAGRTISLFDCLIAATARSFGAAVATRDTAGFADCGIEVINPWQKTQG